MTSINSHKDFFKKKLILLLLVFVITSCSSIERNKSIASSPLKAKALILYYTLYGSTEEVSQWIAEGIGVTADIIPIQDFTNADMSDYDIIILGSAVYMENIALPMRDFLKEHQSVFKNKDTALFVVSGSYLISGERYIELFEKNLDKKPLITAYFGGRMVPEKLSEFHYSIMDKYWSDRGQKVQFFDFTDRGEALEFGTKIRVILSEKKAAK